MKFILPCTLALLLAGHAVSAQLASPGLEGAAGESNLRDFVRGLPAAVPNSASEGVIGSPYADRRWLPARLVVAHALPMPPLMLKYDVLRHHLLMRRSLSGSSDSLELDDTRVAGFVLSEPASPLGPGRQRPFRRFEESPVPAQRVHYVEVLHQGRFALLIYRRKTLLPADKQAAYNTGHRYDTIIDHTAYFISTPEGELRPVKLALRPLQQAAPALAQALQIAVQARKPATETDWAAVLDSADPAVVR